MAITLTTPLAQLLPNKRRVSALKALGVESVSDALTYYPFRVTDPVAVCTLAQGQLGQRMACAVTVKSVRVMPMNARRGYRLEVLVDDVAFATKQHVPSRIASLVFFSYKKSYIDWMATRLQPHMQLVIAGEPSVFNDRLQFTHPEIVTVAPQEAYTASEVPLAFEQASPVPIQSRPGNSPAVHYSNLKYDVDSVAQGLARVTRPRPVYHANSRISSEHIHDTIELIIQLLAGEDPSAKPQTTPDETAVLTLSPAARIQLTERIPDILPADIRERDHLMHRAQALYAIHEPETVKQWHAGIHTMRYEEAFVCQCALLKTRQLTQEQHAYPCANTTLRDQYIASLPYQLTNGQRDVIDTIGDDMSKAHPMQRLLQGEVGSGKTVVAVAAMLQAVGSGHQAVLVAPTQVLAEQHEHSIRASVPDDVPVYLLTGGMKLAARRKVLAAAASGDPCIVVATHAAFSKTFQAPNLALAVIDEQHRFGVEQRETLRAKSDCDPHLLVMTATPIPRTAAMTWFGDLDISWLTELPGGRKPIRTFVIPEDNSRLMSDMFWHIRHRIDDGERAYIICARIDMDEPNDDTPRKSEESLDDAMLLSDDELGEHNEPRPPLHSVEEMAGRLASLPQFKDIAICTLTGRDDDAAKAQIMADFSSGKTPLMVATTVVEVGVDVPQASCITIFDADRYGLSQLHQLRGRVGRGGTESWAFLVSRAQPGTVAEERLQVIAESLDGSHIAQKDLELRGAGDVLGDAQSGGKSSLKLLRVVKDAKMIAHAREQAQALLARDPTLEHHVQLAGAVLDFTRGNELYLTSN